MNKFFRLLALAALFAVSVTAISCRNDIVYEDPPSSETGGTGGGGGDGGGNGDGGGKEKDDDVGGGGEEEGGGDDGGGEVSISIPPTLTLGCNKTSTLTATVRPAGTEVSWSSSAPDIVQVNATTGELFGKGADGQTATITAQAGGKSATCVVTLSATGGEGDDYVKVTKITLAPATQEYVSPEITNMPPTAEDFADKNFTISCTVEPANATFKTVTWTSSAPDVATVDSQGNVTVKGLGAAVIYAKSDDPGVDVQAFSRVVCPSKENNVWYMQWQTAHNKIRDLTDLPEKILIINMPRSKDWYWEYWGNSGALKEELNRSLYEGVEITIDLSMGSITTTRMEVQGESWGGNMGAVKRIILPPTLETICDQTFVDSTLPEFYLPDSVTKIGVKAFENCKKLTSIRLGPRLKEIGGQAFFGCSSLETISIPASVEKIGQAVFWSCTKLADVRFEGTVAQWEAIDKHASWKGNDNSITVVHCTDDDVNVE